MMRAGEPGPAAHSDKGMYAMTRRTVSSRLRELVSRTVHHPRWPRRWDGSRSAHLQGQHLRSHDPGTGQSDLDERGRRDVTLIITGGLRPPANFVKALALGADGMLGERAGQAQSVVAALGSVRWLRMKSVLAIRQLLVGMGGCARARLGSRRRATEPKRSRARAGVRPLARSGRRPCRRP